MEPAPTVPHLKDRVVHVFTQQFPEARYEVRIGSGNISTLLAATADVLPLARRALIVVDSSIEVNRLKATLQSTSMAASSHIHCDFAQLNASESNKSLDAAAKILQHVARAQLDRNDAIISIGGGIVGDVAGFVAAIYRRGIAWVHAPTTLLAMVDASVGGKTGVNISLSTQQTSTSSAKDSADSLHSDLLKNMVGSFHQPRLVLADIGFLATLSERQFRSGLAECVKHALIETSVHLAPTSTESRSSSIWSLLEVIASHSSHSSNGLPSPQSLINLIAINVALKADVVAADPFERAPDSVGGRALLNLGHTFGHALETMNGISVNASESVAPTHGEAIALGLVAAAHASVSLGMLQRDALLRIELLLNSLKLPTRATGLATPESIEHAIARMRHDKKALGGIVRLVLLSGLDAAGRGSACIVKDPPIAAIRDALEYLQVQ